MKVKMRDEDRRAVDVLMDRTAAVSANDAVAYAAADSQLWERIRGVEHVLSLLNEMPASDPPAQLVARTLDAVHQASGRDVVSASGHAAMISGNQPMA